MKCVLTVFNDIKRNGFDLGTATLAIHQRTGLAGSTVGRAVNLLVELGLIRRLKYGTYRVTWRGRK